MRQTVLLVVFLVFMFSNSCLAATKNFSILTNNYYGTALNSCIQTTGGPYNKTTCGSGNVCVYTNWGYFDTLSLSASLDSCGTAAYCSYTYSNYPYPVANGVSSGYQLTGYKADGTLYPGTSSTVYPDDLNRAYLQFDWKPDVTVGIYHSGNPNKGILPWWDYVPTNYQLIWFGNSSEIGLAQFILPGVDANSFKIDFQKLGCGDYKWEIASVARYWNHTGCNSTNPVAGGVDYSGKMAFTKLCCAAAPILSNGAPATGTVYPATTTSVSPSWNLTSSCLASVMEYHLLEVTKPGVSGSDAYVVPVTGVSNTPHSYTVDTSLYTCKTTEQVFNWDVKAKNNRVATVTALPTSGTNTFTIAPNKVQLIPLIPLTCLSPGVAVNIEVKFSDYNVMTDTFRFRLMDGSTQIGSDMFPTCSTSETTTTCPVNFTAPSAVGNYTLLVSHMNNTGTKCSGPGGDSYSTEENVFGIGGTLPVGGSVVGTLGFDSSTTGSTELQAVLNVTSFPIGTMETADITFQYALNSSGVVCDTLSTYTAIPSTWFSGGGSSTRLCTLSDIEDGNCKTNPFIPASSGRYCYKAVVNSGVSGCGGAINNTLEDYVYKTNVHVLRDVNDTLPCEADNTNPSITEGATKLNGKTVTFSLGGTSLQEITTDDSGQASFSFRTSSGGVSPTLSLEIRCGEVDEHGVVIPCISDQTCSSNYIDCAGSDISGDQYAEVPGSFGDNLVYNRDLSLSTPADYNFYLRLGSTSEPDDWLTTVDGDVYASGMALHMCTETSFEGTTFDGGLSERPEGDPYDTKPEDIAEVPYTGGFVFTDSAKEDAVFEVSDDLFTEGNPVGRSAFSINAISGENFKDLRFGLMASSTDNGSVVPSGVTVQKLAGVNLSEQRLDLGSIYLAETVNDMNALLNGGGYILRNNPHGDKVAVIYYTDSGSGNELSFNSNFVNKSGANSGRVVIISAQDIIIDANIGYDCAPSQSDPDQTLCGTTTGGVVTSQNEYSPDDADFPANIDAVLVSYGTITVLGADNPTVTDDVKLLKINGSLIAAGGISFERSLGNLALKYPGEMVRYNSDILYNLTKMERSSAITGLSTSVAQVEYGY